MYTSSKPLLYSELLAKENSFQTDLDGDGNYGDRIYQLKASHDSTGKSLYKTDSGALVVDSNGRQSGDFTESPIVLIKYGKAYNTLYSPTKANEVGFVSHEYQVESEYGGYTSSDQYIYYGSGNSWTKDSFTTGLFTGTKKLNLTELLAEESLYNADLNKDGDIGDTISEVISNNGSKGLYKITSGAYVMDNPGLNPGDLAQSPIIPKINGKPYTFKNVPTGIANFDVSSNYFFDSDNNPIEKESDIYSGLGDTWTKDTFNSETGEFIISDKVHKDYVLWDEVAYQIDLTGDGYFGDKVEKVFKI